MHTACFTGHRPHKLPFGYRENDVNCVLLKQTLSDLILSLSNQYAVTRYLSGLALGADIWASESVLALQKNRPEIKLQAVIPSSDQTEKWTGASLPYRVRYDAILAEIGAENRISTSSERMGGKSRAEMTAMYDVRNHYMVDQSEFVIACWTGEASGTSKTVRYAVEQGKAHIYVLNPYNPASVLEIMPGDTLRLKQITATLKQSKATYRAAPP